jgi:molecular chaperone GrpE (heat shock protein)
MSGKTSGKRTTRTTSKSRTTTSKAKTATKATTKAAGAAKAAKTTKATVKKKATATKATAKTTTKAAPAKPATKAPAKTRTTAKKTTAAKPAPAKVSAPPSFESLSAQLSALQQKLDVLTGTSAADNGNGNGTTVNRAAAVFERLVADAVEDQLAELLPPLIALRRQMAHSVEGNGSLTGDLRGHATQTLDHVLAVAGVETYEARTGDSCDPLIHLPVGETQRDDLPAGAVAEALQPGFRSRRGKVIVPARVRVNRR